ncbi:MAG: hypothetical protein ACLGSD_19475 [Acidobacteriota bacterium]
MRAFGREFDQLEEATILLALVFLITTGLRVAFYYAAGHRYFGSFVFEEITVVLFFFVSLARILSFIAGLISLALWLLRSFGGAFYERLPLNRDKLQHLFKR